ncbi:MAG: DUF4097 family beta strand repeat-containing protein [Armatimonadota bacterium]|nr:DUF4097 family beta strand repeat-containing protein [Armatimonadota bacterium]
MSEERQRVLRMLKDGKVSVEEAEALLEALGEAERDEPGEQPNDHAERPGHAAEVLRAGADGAHDASDEQTGGLRGEFHRMLDDLMKSVDVDGIRESVRESLKRSKADMDRVKEEVRRAADRVREETRRAAREYRRHGWGPISRTIEGLWGLAVTAGAWSHETDVAPGRRVAVHNVWGDVKLAPSPDARLHATAVTRAWGRDETAATALRDAVYVTAADDGEGPVIRVEAPTREASRRFRVDFTLQVPEGVDVEVSQAKGDVEAAGLRAGFDAAVASGDVTVRDHVGRIRVEAARGNVIAHACTGEVVVKARHGRVAMTAVTGPVVVRVMHGDVTLRQPAGPVQFDLETARGDIAVEVAQFAPGTASHASTVSGDVAVRLGPRAACRLRATVTAGDIEAPAGLIDGHESDRALRGVWGAPDASLELSTVSGDVTIQGAKGDVHVDAATAGA